MGHLCRHFARRRSNGGYRNYWRRFGSDHFNLRDVLSGDGGSTKRSLAEMTALADIPIKIGSVDENQVEAYIAEGRLQEIVDYCLTDVIATFRVLLRYEMVRGESRLACLDASMELTGNRYETSGAMAIVVGVPLISSPQFAAKNLLASGDPG